MPAQFPLRPCLGCVRGRLTASFQLGTETDPERTRVAQPAIGKGVDLIAVGLRAQTAQQLRRIMANPRHGTSRGQAIHQNPHEVIRLSLRTALVPPDVPKVARAESLPFRPERLYPAFFSFPRSARERVRFVMPPRTLFLQNRSGNGPRAASSVPKRDAAVPYPPRKT